MREGLLIAGVVAIISVSFRLVQLGQSYSCKNKADLMGMKHDYRVSTGCMIEVKPGQWIPLANYRVL